jgi:hypothetical protein
MRAVTGHVVTYPGPGPHRKLRLMTDVQLLLADTIASVRMNTRLVVFDPLGPVQACPECRAAYEEARRVIAEAGGLALWTARFCGPRT